ncbi:TIGR02679 family protein [Phytohabitans sp. ZYX-F-186]|uniref:TIGR02679 family protein n=1 Tax=Phytohabitans maris TaxID=3071409 RepID=A0ABU0Z7M6_9ACTN|nr:TIGR02679 family protein [Phytohabitans sp. ZYX-F-186]MDQ7903058.1 TIGR02679 family protein [Phytohabitans sp. ZYX-F-186]
MSGPPEDPGWVRLLAAARRSLERSGGSLDGSISVTAPTEAERLVVIGVTGAHRSATAQRLTVSLAELDAFLRAAHGASLADVLSVTKPLRNRPGELKQEAVARDALLSIAREGRHGTAGWYEEWLEGMRRDGTLTRVIRTGLPFTEVVRVLDALPAADEPMPVFAERVLDDTKALADGAVRGLVLRALAAWQEVAAPANTEQERALWESVGVVPDDLASQVLVLNLPASGGLVGSWLGQARQAGVPMRLTLHQLRLGPLRLECDEIFVCENPAVLRAAAARFGPGARPLACTEGTPSAAAHQLLRYAADATIRWRNDFDWVGLRLTAAALARYPNAVPWRMTGDDYLRAAGSGPALLGTRAESPWDPTLADALSRVGRAVMEERLLDDLLSDLARPRP